MDRNEVKAKRNARIKELKAQGFKETTARRKARKEFPLRRQRRTFYSKKDRTKKEFLTKKRR